MINYILEHWFYLFGFLYILNCIHDIICRAKNKVADVSMDITDINSIKDSHKKLVEKSAKWYFTLIIILLFSWTMIGINCTVNLEKLYFSVILIIGYVIPIFFSIVSSVSVYNKMKKSGDTKINSKDLNESKLMKEGKLFSSLLNVFEIIFISLILNNHFNLI